MVKDIACHMRACPYPAAQPWTERSKNCLVYVSRVISRHNDHKHTCTHTTNLKEDRRPVDLSLSSLTGDAPHDHNFLLPWDTDGRKLLQSKTFLHLNLKNRACGQATRWQYDQAAQECFYSSDVNSP